MDSTSSTSKTTITKEPGANGAADGSAQSKRNSPTSLVKVRRKKSKKWLYAIAALVVVGVASWFLFFKGEAAQVTIIRFAAVDKGDIVKSVTATGTLQATTTVQVGSQVSGTIKALHADFNTRVKKGDLIAELDPTFIQASVKAATANYEKSVADMEIAKRNAARSKDLLDKNLISKAEYDQSETTYLTSQASVKQTKAALDQANVNLSYTQIHAPISGVVTQRSVDVGQTVAASLNAPVLFIIAEDLREMEVQANVDEADIGQVKQNENVSFTVDAFPGEKFNGMVKMVRLNPVVQQNVVTYTVIISAQNPEEKLFPGMTATVAIVNASAENVIRIPSAAMRFIPPNMDNSAGPKSPRTFNRDSLRAKGGDSTRSRRGGGGGDFAIIYKKSTAPNQNPENPTMEPVRIKAGISDGMFSQVLWSDKPLTPGDSIAVGSITPSKTGTPNMPGTNPFGTSPRPGGGGGGRRQ
jgi:HlyD family secretion protein